MLIALTVMILFGGGNEPLFDKETRVAIKQTVTDSARQKAVLAILKGIESKRKKPHKSAAASRKDLARLELDRSADAKDIQATLDEILESRRGVQQALVDGIFEMREIMTAEEWQAVFGSGS